MKEKHNAGDEIYSIDGRAGSYVAKVHNGHMVEPIYDDEDSGEPRFGRPVVWPEVFAKPPVERVHSEVAEAERKLQSVRAELAQLREERAAFDHEERARLDRLKQHEQLAALDDYLAGRITHFVVTGGYEAPYILTYEQAIVTTDEDQGRKNLRMMGLFGDPKRNLRWKIMWYSDGSGSTKYEVFPCTSLEQAKEKLAAVLSVAWDEVRKEGKYHLTTRSVKVARDMGLAVPQDIADHADRIRREAAQKAIQSRRQELERAQKNLAEVEQEFAGVIGVGA